MEEELGALVMQTTHRIMRMVRQEHTKRGVMLSMQQGMAMRFISHHPGCSLSDLSKRTGATSSATSKIVDGLVERGFVKREMDPGDRRKITLCLTELGQADKDSVERMAEALAAEKLSSLSEKELELVRAAMKLLQSVFVQQNVDCTMEVSK